MRASKRGAILLCLGLVACGDKRPKSASMQDAMPFVPLPPQATFLNQSRGPDALQITVRSGVKPDEVTAYYRGILKRNGWQVVSDAKDNDGAAVILAQKNGPPLWIRVQSTEGGAASLVQLMGAVVARTDTAAAKPAS
jgi:hypothetical protein